MRRVITADVSRYKPVVTTLFCACYLIPAVLHPNFLMLSRFVRKSTDNTFFRFPTNVTSVNFVVRRMRRVGLCDDVFFASATGPFS